MKIIICLCCIAYLLTEISARLRLTTPMPSTLPSNDFAARQLSNIAEMIVFVNSVYNNDGRSIARSGKYDPMLRRRQLELPAVKSINLPASAVVPTDEDTKNQLENLAHTVRYQVIDNPEVLEEYSNKRKKKNIEKLLNPVSVVSDTSAEAKSFSTVENKLRYYHSKSKSTSSHKSTENNNLDQLHHTPHLNPLDGVQEITTVEPTYRPSFPDDDDDDDDKFMTEDIEETITEKENTIPRADEKNYSGRPKMNKTVEIEKRILDNKASGKEDKARIKEEAAQMGDTKETGQMKHELPLKKDKNNDNDGVTDGVTVNEEKSGSNKEYISTKLDYNSNKRSSNDNVRPKDEDYKNDGNKKINGTTDSNSEKDNKPKERSWDANKIIHIPVETLMGRIERSALRTEQKINSHDHKEQHSIYSPIERNENNNKQFKNRHEKRDEYDRENKYNNDDRWNIKENDWNKIDKQRHNKDNGYDRMEYEWNKRHQQFDKNYNWNINGNQWDKNNDFNSRDRDSNKRDNDWDKRDNDWKKRDFDSNKRDNDWNNRDNDWNNRDTESNTKDNDWNNRDNEWIQKDGKTYNDDRNKNDWVRKQNEWEHKYSDLSVENDGGAHERYEIVERKRKYADYNRHSEV